MSNTEQNTAKESIGVIGTGMLGSAVAIRLAKNGRYDVSVCNRTMQKTKAAELAGAAVLKTPAQVAQRSDFIMIILKDEHAVKNVSFEQNGSKDAIISGLSQSRKKPVIMDMSTINPAISREITAQYETHGITKIDTPVMGGPDAASAGSLVAMVSGSKKAFESCKMILDEISKEVRFLDEEPGVAHTVKLAMNMQITMLALSLAEGITLVDRSGTNPKIFLDVLNATYFGTGMSRKKAYNMIDKNQNPTFTLANLRKDIKIMTETAANLGLDLPMTSMAEKVYADALENGHGHLDYTGIIRHIEKCS